MTSDEVLGLFAGVLATRWRSGNHVDWDGAGTRGSHFEPEPREGWEEVAKLAARHRVAGAVYRQAAKHEGILPPGLVRELGRAGAFDALICDAWIADISDLLQALAEARVAALVTKGWALTATVFRGDTSIRPSGDIDVLVKREKIARAKDRLLDLGYTQMSREPWPGFNERYKYAAVFRRLHSGITSLEVELHWGLLDVPFFDRIPIPDWFERARRIELAGVEALVPSPEDHFVYLCGHLGLHHRYEPFLFRYHDMAALVTDGGEHAGHRGAASAEPSSAEAFDWEAVLDRAREWRLVIALGESLARLADLWPEVVPTEVLERAAAAEPSEAERRVHAVMAERHRTPTADLALALSTMPGIGRRLRFLMEQAVPSPRYVRERYPPRWSPLWPLGYFERGWRGLKHTLSQR